MSIAGIPGECREAQSGAGPALAEQASTCAQSRRMTASGSAQPNPTDVTNLLRDGFLGLWSCQRWQSCCARKPSRYNVTQFERGNWVADRTLQVFDGDEWEDFALLLLQERHGALNVHKIPADDQGDLGLDYFCISEGVVYQCYAVEEPVSIAQRADKQKTKITVDLGKFVKNSAEILQLMHGQPVKRWVLLVPLHNSKAVNLHAAKKAEEIKALQSGLVDADFEVVVQDLDCFPETAIERGITQRSTIRFEPLEVRPEEIEGFSKSQPPGLLQNLYDKLRKRVNDGSGSIDEVANSLLSDLLKRDNVLERLKTTAPPLYEKIQMAIRRRLRYLQTMGVGNSTPHAILTSQFDELKREVLKTLPNLSDDDAEMVAYGTIASWLMMCPLDFPEIVRAA